MKVEWLTLSYKPCPEDETPARFSFECPRRPGHMCSGLMLSGVVLPDGTVRGKEKDSKKTWAWNGDRAAPTFKPSINCLAHNPENLAQKYGGCGAHGYITNGQWTDA